VLRWRCLRLIRWCAFLILDETLLLTVLSRAKGAHEQGLLDRLGPASVVLGIETESMRARHDTVLSLARL